MAANPASPLAAVLDQLAAHREQINRVDQREADHYAALNERLSEIADLITGIGTMAADHAAVLARVEALDQQVTDLATRLADGAPGGQDSGGYRPGPPPRWWKLTPEARQEAVARLRAWVEQVYRPGYGQLAAALGPCWEQHPLCLYALDIAAELWSVLYLQTDRTGGLLSAQAEYHTRILPALADQLTAETSRCHHTHAPVGGSVNGRARSAP